MLEHVMETISLQDSFQFSTNFNNMMWNLINFSQTEIGYAPKYEDIISSIVVSGLSSFTLAKDSELSKYQGDGFDTLIEMMHQLSDDIYNTWKASCTSLPCKELIVMSLINLAGKLSNKEGYIFAPADMMAQLMNLDLSKSEDCDCENCSGDCSCHEVENENGSN
jgi:hypothetical protein